MLLNVAGAKCSGEAPPNQLSKPAKKKKGQQRKEKKVEKKVDKMVEEEGPINVVELLVMILY